MDAEKLKYQYGRCSHCGSEFDDELRNKHVITYCPWCGTEIDDFLSFVDSGQEEDRKDDIFCEECGSRIYERDGEGGFWLGQHAGECSGPCKRNLCGRCADWDINGECEMCRNSPCGQCQNHDVVEMCQECEHLPEREKWAGYKKPDPCDACGVHSEVGCRGCLKN